MAGQAATKGGEKITLSGVGERATYHFVMELFRPRIELLWSLHSLATELVRHALSAFRYTLYVTRTQLPEKLHSGV